MHVDSNTAMTHNDDMGTAVPLKAEMFEILMRLTEGDSHGYAIMRDVAARSDGAVNMLPGTLYRHLRSMLSRGLIEEIKHRKAVDADDQRRRIYRITAIGLDAAKAEAVRLERQVSAARRRNLIPGARSG